jgi:hypothetical protein
MTLRELLRRGDPATGVGAPMLSRVERRLKSESSWPLRAPPLWRIALATPLLAGAPLAIAAVIAARVAWRAPEAPPAPGPVRRAVHPHLAAEHAIEHPIEPPSPELLPVPHRSLRISPPPSVRSASGGSVAAEPESPLAAETRALGQALRQLNDERDAQGALASLAHYRGAFPHGVLRQEADIARVDAALQMGLRQEALSALETLDVADGVPRAAELRVLHGELLAGEGRCREALPHFDAAAARPAPAGVRGRALYGRAICRRETGDVEGSREDFGAYLSAFPQGPFARVAKEALDAP